MPNAAVPIVFMTFWNISRASGMSFLRRAGLRIGCTFPSVRSAPNPLQGLDAGVTRAPADHGVGVPLGQGVVVLAASGDVLKLPAWRQARLQGDGYVSV